LKILGREREGRGGKRKEESKRRKEVEKGEKR
jgi:hypothetical protein